MNRLTGRDEYGNADIIGVDSEDFQLNLDFEGFYRVTEALNRLAAYEDTGLEPEEVERYAQDAQAEKDGRLLVPPCNVGDTVWLIVQGMSSPMPVPVCSLTWRGGKWSINADREETEPPKVVGFQIGKTAFLTREDAEKALEGMKNDER